jgi:hypothetical protein
VIEKQPKTLQLPTTEDELAKTIQLAIISGYKQGFARGFEVGVSAVGSMKQDEPSEVLFNKPV